MTAVATRVRKPFARLGQPVGPALIQQLHDLGSAIVYSTGAAPAVAPGDIWTQDSDLADIAAAPHQRLLAAVASSETGANRRASSGALMLRYGTASGFLIGTWLATGQVVLGARLALRFSTSAVLAGVRVTACTGVMKGGDDHATRLALIHELTTHAAPLVEAHHHWSGFSRKALWAMVVSSWVEQIIHLTELMCEPERGLAEAQALLAVDPDIAAVAPDVYMVRASARRAVCQKRALCCLWFKGPRRQLCTSCPIMEDGERLARNQRTVARRGLPDAGHAGADIADDRKIA